MNDSIICGVDIGGSHITAALVSMDTNQILPHTLKRRSIHTGGTKDEIILTWCQTINESFDAHGMVAHNIGIAMPGPFDYDKGICFIKGQQKYDALYGIDIKHSIAEQLLIPPGNIKISNDASCFLMGEVFSGAAKNCKNVLGLTLGTGFGSAIYNGYTTDANLWCSPFMSGIAEDYFSTRWFTRKYAEINGIKVSNVKALMERMDAEPCIRVILREFAQNLAHFLVPVIKLNAIEMVVIGGNISRAFDYFSPELISYVNNILPGTRIEKNHLGESSALIGAASSHFKLNMTHAVAY